MKQAVLALILAAAPLAATAQSTGQGAGVQQDPHPVQNLNLGNPQDQENGRMQPPQAHQDPNSGPATAMPTPTLNRTMTPVPTAPRS